MALKNYIKTDNFGKDFLASIVVFFVAVPLCLGIAVASGLPPASGLISGVIGGVIVSSIGGSPLQISGPAAGLVTIVYEILQKGGPERLGAVVFFAGLIQIVIGIFKLGPVFRAVSPTLIQAMLTGIGILVFSSQFHIMVDDLPKSNGLLNIISLPEAVFNGLSHSHGTSHYFAALIGILTISTVIIWKYLPGKFKYIPATLVGVLLSVFISNYFRFPIEYINIPKNFWSAISFPSIKCFKCLLEWEVLIQSLTVAFIASAETLLTCSVIDLISKGIKTKYNKEIIAQGIGNSIAGLVGALPITGVIVRSSANINAGAKTRVSGLLHGVWILGLVMFLPELLKLVPKASLAAILVYTGYKLVDVKALKSLTKLGKFEIFTFITTVLMIVSTSLFEGIIIGFVLSVMRLLYVFSYIDIKVEEDSNSNRFTVHIKGGANFLNLPKLAATLEKIPLKQEVYICFDEFNYIDHACLELVINWEKAYQDSGGKVVIAWNELEASFDKPHLVSGFRGSI